MKVDAGTLAAHLRLVSMKGRIGEAVFEDNFGVEVTGPDEEVVMKGSSEVKYKIPDKEALAVMDVADFLKVIDSFTGEVEVLLKDGKATILGGSGTISYQMADPDTIGTTMKNFKKVEKTFFDKNTLSVEVTVEFLEAFGRFQKLMAPDIVQLFLKGKRLMAKLISSRGHEADVEVAKFEKAPTAAQKSKVDGFKVSAAALRDVLDGVVLIDEETFTLDVCNAIRIRYRKRYTFIVSKQVEITE